jgi:cytochrome P450 family 135
VSALPHGPAMGRLAGTVSFHRDPLGFLRRCQQEFGDLFTIRLTTVGRVVVVCDPSSAQALADSDPGPAGAGEARRGVLPMASPLSIFGGDGAEHDAARGRIEAAFAPQAVDASSPAIEQLIARHVKSWPRGRPTRLLPLMRRLADQVFVREVLGVDDPRATELARAIGRMLWTPGNPPVTIPGPADGLLGRVVDLLYRRRRAPIARLIERELQERRVREDPGRGVLAMLLAEEPGREDECIVDELLALLMAAQEPMAAALSWLALRVGSEREALRRLIEEGGEGPFALAVIDETLRLHPPAVAMLRQSAERVVLAGAELPAATSIMAPIPLLHRDPRRFSEADRFMPERHLHGGAGEGAMWPFGRGARSCIGQALARMQLRLLLRALLEHVTVTPLGRQPERMVLRGTILVPQRSGAVVLGERR